MNMNSSFTTSSTPYVPSKRRIASGLNSSMSDLHAGAVNNSFTAAPGLLPQNNRDIFYQNERAAVDGNPMYAKLLSAIPNAGSAVGMGVGGMGGVAAMP